MSDYFDAYTAAVVSQFLEENYFNWENAKMPEFNILDVKINVPNFNGNTNTNNFIANQGALSSCIINYND